MNAIEKTKGKRPDKEPTYEMISVARGIWWIVSEKLQELVKKYKGQNK